MNRLAPPVVSPVVSDTIMDLLTNPPNKATKLPVLLRSATSFQEISQSHESRSISGQTNGSASQSDLGLFQIVAGIAHV